MSISTLHIEKKMTSVPKLRFTGFDGDWEKSKLNKFASLNPKNSVLPESFIYIDLESVKDGLLIKESVISKNEAPSRAQRILKDKDILYQTVRPYQKNNLYFDKVGDYVASTGYAQIRTINDSQFLFQFLHTEKFVANVMLRCTGTSYPAINSSDLSSIEISFPTLPEQQKIASFLSAVDEKIQQLSRKKELLEQYKKGVMQQLFSGKLRFKDENGKDYPDWEEKSFGSVTKFINGKAYKQTELLSEGKYRVLRVGNLFSNNDWYYSDLELEKDKYIEKGDLIYAWSASFGPRFWDEEKLIYHYHIWKVIPNHNVDKQFLFHTFMFDVEKLKTQSQGGTMFHITKGNIESRLFNFPCVEEQKKIANFLSSIDAKIESASQQIKQTQSFKKGLLQQLFV